MRMTPAGAKSGNFVDADLRVKILLDPEVQAEGAVTGNVLRFPADVAAAGFDALIWQKTADIADSGTLLGKVQESADGSSYSDVTGGAFTLCGADNLQQLQIRITKPYLKYVATAGGGGMGTVEATAGFLA